MAVLQGSVPMTAAAKPKGSLTGPISQLMDAKFDDNS